MLFNKLWLPISFEFRSLMKYNGIENIRRHHGYNSKYCFVKLSSVIHILDHNVKCIFTGSNSLQNSD